MGNYIDSGDIPAKMHTLNPITRKHQTNKMEGHSKQNDWSSNTQRIKIIKFKERLREQAWNEEDLKGHDNHMSLISNYFL